MGWGGLGVGWGWVGGGVRGGGRSLTSQTRILPSNNCFCLIAVCTVVAQRDYMRQTDKRDKEIEIA